jgi:hypothetical protein
MDTPARRREAARLRDLIYFRSPQLWRWWPFLPVARPAPDGNGRQCGVLYDARGMSNLYGYSATVFLANVFLLPETEAEFLTLPHIVYDTAEEIAADGWTVD